jgi:hypothetical protein
LGIVVSFSPRGAQVSTKTGQLHVVVTAATDRWGYPAPPNRVLKKPVSLTDLLNAVRGGGPATG